MSKNQSLVELVSFNNKNGRKDEFQIRTKIYPDLPNLQNTKSIIKYSTNFRFTESGYTTEFSKYKTPFNVRYEIIYKNMYEYF